MTDAKTYYLEQNYNCAESILREANEKYQLGLTDQAMKLVAGFGGGMGCGKACGALCSCIAVLSSLYCQDKAHETAGFKEKCALFVQDFLKANNSLNCEDIKKTNFASDGTRCLKTVLQAQELLDIFVKSN